ncbi:MAG: hypothetical protein MZV49_25570 [Rhodopseudomonas palustris]|nr:hypothetical protein [Rhodopseudomonas palustris]
MRRWCATLWSYHSARSPSGLGAWLTVPGDGFLAVIIIGGFQHQLGGCIHEGTSPHPLCRPEEERDHFGLVRGIPDLHIDVRVPFCIIWRIISSSTIRCAIQTLLRPRCRATGSIFLLTQYELLLSVNRQLNPIRLGEARPWHGPRYSAVGTDQDPYADKKRMACALGGARWRPVRRPHAAGGGDADPARGLAAGVDRASGDLGGGTGSFYALIPDEDYAQSRINPIYLASRDSDLAHGVSRRCSTVPLTRRCYLTGAPAWGLLRFAVALAAVHDVPAVR